MAHQEYIRILPNCDRAVLLIHGIVGTPDHFLPFLNLIPGDWSVCNILLEGHGGSTDDFSRASMKKWKTQVASVLDGPLAHCNKIIIVGHSMGTLFAVGEALRRPKRITSLFLLQVPLRVRVRLKTAFCAGLLPFGIVLKPVEGMKADSGVDLDPRLWKYLGWIPRFAELLAECARIRRALPALKVPCQAFQSGRDELVSMKSCRELARCDAVKITVLPECDHFVYQGENLRLLQQRFQELFAEAE